MWGGEERFGVVYTGRFGGGSLQIRWVDIFLQSGFVHDVMMLECDLYEMLADYF